MKDYQVSKFSKLRTCPDFGYFEDLVKACKCGKGSGSSENILFLLIWNSIKKHFTVAILKRGVKS